MYKQFSHYPAWSRLKLLSASISPEVVLIKDPSALSHSELKLIQRSIDQFNFCIYQFKDQLFDPATQISKFGLKLGLKRYDAHLCLDEDKLTKIFDDTQNSKSFYIPYTNRSINWHTDGYYNQSHQVVYSFLLHCSQPAFEGGENTLLDPDQVFIYLMQQNPEFIKALMQPDVMTIPENRRDGKLIRCETSTAIFSVNSSSHHVLMRYSMRKKNISFKQDVLTREALECMDGFINSSSAPSIQIKLAPNQGVVSNNVLHKRSAFMDKIGKERLYYRARYYNRIHIKQ